MAPGGGEGLFQSRLRRRPRTTTSRGSYSRLWTQIGADYGLRVDGGRGGWRELGGATRARGVAKAQRLVGEVLMMCRADLQVQQLSETAAVVANQRIRVNPQPGLEQLLRSCDSGRQLLSLFGESASDF